MQKVYLETTIPSYLTAQPSRDIVVAGRQEVTRVWWNTQRKRFSLYVSLYVLNEVSRGNSIAAEKRMGILDDIPILMEDEEVLRLTESILNANLIPHKAATDASHIAIATRHGMDFLLTWNCAHIANAEIVRDIDWILTEAGYDMPVVCTPDELMGGEFNERSDSC